MVCLDRPKKHHLQYSSWLGSRSQWFAFDQLRSPWCEDFAIDLRLELILGHSACLWRQPASDWHYSRISGTLTSSLMQASRSSRVKQGGQSRLRPLRMGCLGSLGSWTRRAIRRAVDGSYRSSYRTGLSSMWVADCLCWSSMNGTRKLAALDEFLMEAILPQEEGSLVETTCCTQMTDPGGYRNRRMSLPCSDQIHCCDFSVCLQRYSRHYPQYCDGSLPSSSTSAVVVTLGSVSLLLFKW